MNKLLSSLGAKISAIVLFIVNVIVLAVTVTGIVMLAMYGVYFDNGESRKNDLYDYYATLQIEEVRSLLENELEVPDGQMEQDSSFPEDGLTEDVVLDAQSMRTLRSQLDQKNTNLSMKICLEDGTQLFQNYEVKNPVWQGVRYTTVLAGKKEQSEVLIFKRYQDRWRTIQEYEKAYHDVSYDYYDEDTDNDGLPECILDIHYTTGEELHLLVEERIAQELVAKDRLYFQMKWINLLIGIRYYLIVFAGLAAIAAVLLFIFLMCSAGHKAGAEGVRLNWMDKIPFDLYFAAALFTAGISVACLMEGFDYTNLGYVVIGAILAVLALLLVLGMLMSFAARAKCGAWWKNTVIYRLLVLLKTIAVKLWKGICHLVTSIPVIWKTVVALAVLSALSLLLLLTWDFELGLVLWLLCNVIFVPLIMLVAINFQKLEQSVRELGEGNFNSRIDVARMMPGFRKFAEDINHINEGMAKEVSERMKSEHLKTELITNVSHDIKTPLTSIINYVDLIRKEKPENETICSYIEVLERQSGRLKKLIEDLVECSKATTGNIKVQMTPIDAGILLEQAAGEYKEKFAANQLSMLIDKPEHPVIILADGRYLWRVFDNLLGNACKYSLPSSRVYLSLEETEQEVRIIFRNISKTRLNVSGEELLERFVRGDSSRNTEGSGLGLSIAESLIKLQNGSFRILVDGDLFKVVITFQRTGV